MLTPRWLNGFQTRAFILSHGRSPGGPTPRPPARARFWSLAAGTADQGAAEEAAVCAETMGNRVDRLYDVGVAGLHRLLAEHARLLAARVVIVVAGMEGALPSVVGGLVDVPVTRSRWSTIRLPAREMRSRIAGRWQSRR